MNNRKILLLFYCCFYKRIDHCI